VDDALGDPLVIEVGDLLEEGRPAPPDPQRVLIITDRNPLVGGEHRVLVRRALVELVTAARDGMVERFALVGLVLGHHVIEQQAMYQPGQVTSRRS
jgi:hypothetical protein